jgi:hypothetical protein
MCFPAVRKPDIIVRMILGVYPIIDLKISQRAIINILQIAESDGCPDFSPDFAFLRIDLINSFIY